jgi:glycerate kinase
LKIVVALDSFKHSLTAVEACEVTAAAIRSAAPDADVVTKPMADGGEGTASVLMAAAGGRWIGRTVMGPLPEMEVEAGFVQLPGPAEPIRNPQSAIRNRQATALVEMATASGLPLLKPEQRNPLKTTTYGTGQLIRAAIDYGANRILLAIGGSATVDGGVGAAMALGWRFLAEDGQEIGLGGGRLSRIAKIVAPIRSTGILPVSHRQDADATRSHGRDGCATHGQDAHATEAPGGVAVEVLCDVDNPLCGEHGAARIYGPQKGATPEMVEELDAGLAHLARLVKEQLGRDIAELPGAGAAGGLAAGAVAFMNARLVSGIEAVMEQTHLGKDLAGADWVITGEGCFDEQSLRGKVVSGIIRMARSAGTRVAVLAGQVRLPPESYRPAGVEAALPCMEQGMALDDAISHGAALLDRAARRLASDYIFAERRPQRGSP